MPSIKKCPTLLRAFSVLALSLIATLSPDVTSSGVQAAYAGDRVLSTDSKAADYIASIEKLMKSKDRPTIAEFLNAFGGQLPKENPFTLYRKLGGQKKYSSFNSEVTLQSDFLMEVRQRAPEMVAYLERSYPGATFAPLGRDAAAIGDWLDAFFTTIGQTGRVIRITASTGTVAGSEDQLRLLESVGLNLDQVKEAAPILIMDRTSYGTYGDGSQTGGFLRAAYDEYERRGGKRSDLVRKLNVVAISQWHGGNEPEFFSDHIDIDAFLKIQERHVDKSSGQPNNRKAGLPRTILTFPAQRATGAVCDGPEWHNGYVKMEMREDGTWGGAVGSQADSSYRFSILETQYLTQVMMSDPQFLADVQSQAKRLGYTFPLERSIQPIPIDFAEAARYQKKILTSRRLSQSSFKNRAKVIRAKDFKQVDAELLKVVQALPLGEDVKKSYISPNAQMLVDQLKELSEKFGEEYRERLGFMTLWYASMARRDLKIGGKDLRRIVAYTLIGLDLESESTVQTLEALIKKDPGLAYVFSNKAWSFAPDAKTHDSEKVAKKFEIIRARILEPMGCELVLTKPAD